eukprot:COSAG01_NODE_11911_length_1836_cov_10.918250_1_plen_102_part_00
MRWRCGCACLYYSEVFAVPTLTPDHPDYAAGMEIQGNSGPSTDTRAQYTKKWEVFKLYCETYRWNPWAFSIELATLFAAHISTRNKRVQGITSLTTTHVAF